MNYTMKGIDITFISYSHHQISSKMTKKITKREQTVQSRIERVCSLEQKINRIA